MKRFISLSLVIFALSLAALAQTLTPIQQTVSNFGLVGSCSATAKFVYSNGTVSEVITFDRGGERTYTYSEAHLIDSTHLSVTATLSDNFNSSVNGAVQTMTYLKLADGRFLTVSNVQSDGTVVVKDGVVVSSGYVLRPWGPCQ